MAIDDCTRLVYAEMLPNEKKETTTGFALRALRWFKEQGIKVYRVLTDNGPSYRSKLFNKLLQRLKLRHLLTRPYHPQTNGKAERWIQTSLREYFYKRIFNSSDERKKGLPGFLEYYNDHRNHHGINLMTPREKLLQLQAMEEMGVEM